jgi:hypothetical protein
MRVYLVRGTLPQGEEALKQPKNGVDNVACLSGLSINTAAAVVPSHGVNLPLQSLPVVRRGRANGCIFTPYCGRCDGKVVTP